MRSARASLLAASQESAAGKGIACIVASGFISALHDSITKWLTGGYPVGEVMFFRGLAVFVPLALLVWRAGGLDCLIVRRPGAQALRALFFVASSALFVTSVSLLPLADTIALTFTGPLFVTALAPFLLGERVGWRRWTAVLVGFIGVVVIVRPAGSALQLVALVPVASALMGAFRDIVTRRMTAGENTTAILFYSTLAVTAAGLATLPFGWNALGLSDAGLFLIGGLLTGVSQYLGIQAFRYAEAAAIVPFKYLTLVWAGFAGFVVFGDVPGRPVLIGAAFVVGSGLYILRRETRRRRQAAPKEKKEGGA